MQQATQQVGLSLIEVMIVVAIMAIAAGISIPMFVHYVEINRTKLAAEEFYNNISRARAEALKTSSDIVVSIQTGSNWCYGLTDTSSCDCSVSGNCDLGQVEATKYKNAVTDLSAVGITNTVTFDADRGTADPSGTLTFTSGSGAISVQVTPAGSAQVCSSDFGDYEPC